MINFAKSDIGDEILLLHKVIDKKRRILVYGEEKSLRLLSWTHMGSNRYMITIRQDNFWGSDIDSKIEVICENDNWILQSNDPIKEYGPINEYLRPRDHWYLGDDYDNDGEECVKRKTIMMFVSVIYRDRREKLGSCLLLPSELLTLIIDYEDLKTVEFISEIPGNRITSEKYYEEFLTKRHLFGVFGWFGINRR
jgi:hypothetical protein